MTLMMYLTLELVAASVALLFDKVIASKKDHKIANI